MTWRIVIEITSDSRRKAEWFALEYARVAHLASDNGETIELPEGLGTVGRMECGDPGLSHSPQDVDLALADAGVRDVFADEAELEAAE